MLESKTNSPGMERITSYELLKALKNKYAEPRGRFVLFEELRIGTGYGEDAEQRIDAWVIDCYPSKGAELTSFEVKVSRSDFKQEIKNPLKRQPALSFSNRFYFVAPQGLIRPEEVPMETGLMEYSDDTGQLKIKVVAPFREVSPPSWKFVASVARRVFRNE